MDEMQRKQITEANENYVDMWFKASGFAAYRLDSRGGIPGGSADWKFVKHDFNVICEVKTIFSAGQSGFTPEQYKRYKLELKRKFDYYKAQTKQGEVRLIPHQNDEEYTDGINAYIRRTLPKEDGFNNFLEDVRKQLREIKTSINYHFPFLSP